MSVTNGRLSKAEAALFAHYATLTPSERFRLLVAASSRGDLAEQVRIANAGGWISMSVREFVPLAQALGETDLHVYIELGELAAEYLDAFHVASAADPTPQDDSAEDWTGTDRAAVQAHEVDAERVTPVEQVVAFGAGYGLPLEGPRLRAGSLFCGPQGLPIL